MAVTLGSLLYKIKASNKQFKSKMSENQDELGNLEDTAEDIGEGISNSFLDATKKVAAFGAKLTAVAGAATGVLIGLTSRVADYGDELDKTSMRMGIATDTLQEFRFAGEQMGVEASTLERALYRLNREMGAAENVSGRAQDRLEQLGIETENVEDAFVQAIHAISQYETQQERTAAASDLFGRRAARQLLPIIEQGADEFQNLRIEAHELGIVMDEEAIEKSVEFHDTMHALRETISAVWRTIAVQFMPRFQDWLEYMVTQIPKLQDVWWFTGQVFDVVTTRMAGYFRRLREESEPLLKRLKEIGEEIKEVWDDEDLTFEEKVIETGEIILENLIFAISNIMFKWIEDKFNNIKEIWEAAKDYFIHGEEDAFEEVEVGIGEIIFTIGAWKLAKAITGKKVLGGILAGLAGLTGISKLSGTEIGIKEKLGAKISKLWVGIKSGAIKLFSGVTAGKVLKGILGGIGGLVGFSKVSDTAISIKEKAELKIKSIATSIKSGAWFIAHKIGDLATGLYSAIAKKVSGMWHIAGQKAAGFSMWFREVSIATGSKAWSLAVSGGVIATGIGKAIAGGLKAAGIKGAAYLSAGALGLKFSLPIAILGVLSFFWDDEDVEAPMEDIEERIEHLENMMQAPAIDEDYILEILKEWREAAEITVEEFEYMKEELIGNSIIPEMVQGIYQEFVWLNKMLVGNSVVPDTTDAITEEFRKLGDETIAESKSMTEIIRILWEEMLARMAERTEKDLEDIRQDFDDFDPGDLDLDEGVDEVGRTWERVENIISRGLTDLITDFQNWEDILKRIADRLAEMAIEQFIVEPVIGWAAGGLGMETAHTGGAIKNRGVVRDIPSYHSGGEIGPDERVIKVQTGERILSREENAEYERNQTGQPIVINATDAQSFVDRLHENGHAIIDEVSRDMINNGTLRQLVREFT